MDTRALAQKMRRLQIRIDEACGFAARQYRLGEIYVSMDPPSEPNFASGNHNRIHLCGADGLNEDGLRSLMHRFERDGIRNYFVWLSPGAGVDQMRGWIRSAGFSLAKWTGYPVLARIETPSRCAATNLTVREVDAKEIARARSACEDLMLWRGYEACFGKPGFHHFMAFDGASPVAFAALAVFEGIGYLGWMTTAEEHRRRGAQQALIAARVAKAEALGCTLVVSETLTMLQTSLGNLRRAGFREVFEREVYGFER